jgi:phosphatidylglycerophosphate synthase
MSTVYERLDGAAAPSWRLGAMLVIFIPLVGIPTILLTRLLAWIYHPALFERTVPTVSKTAAFAPGSFVFTAGMTLAAAAIVLAWPIVHARNARAIAAGGARGLVLLNRAALAAGMTAGFALAALAIVTLEVNDPAHVGLSKLFFGAQVLALLFDGALSLRLDPAARARTRVCLAVAASALVFLVAFLVKDADALAQSRAVRWIYVGSESVLCILLLCYSLTYLGDFRRGAARQVRAAPGVGEVLAAYRPRFAHELRTEWAVALLYRPVSLAVTPLAAACGIAPLAVTLAGAACALALPVAALLGAGPVAVGLLAVAFCVLDCMDGDLARATGRVSRAGAYADFIVDLVYRCALYAAIGLLVGGIGLAVGLLCALFALLARAGRLYAETAQPAAAGAAPGPLLAFVSGLDHLLPVAVIVLGALDALAPLLGYLLLYSLGDFVLTQRSVLARLK